MTRSEEIEKAMLDEMLNMGIEDTPTNRYDFLRGLRDAWMEDPDDSPEKHAYVLACNVLILRQTINLFKERVGLN